MGIRFPHYILGKMSDEYKAAVEAFVQDNGVPLLHFDRGMPKDDLAAEYRARHSGQEGIVFIGIAQERAYAYKARKRAQGKQFLSCEDLDTLQKSSVLYNSAERSDKLCNVGNTNRKVSRSNRAGIAWSWPQPS